MRSSLGALGDGVDAVAMRRQLSPLSSSDAPITATTSGLRGVATPAAASVTSDNRPRYRRRHSRRFIVPVVLAVILLVAQASVAGGLAADSDRKSRRKQSPHVVESSPTDASPDIGRDVPVIDSPPAAQSSSGGKQREAVHGQASTGDSLRSMSSLPWRNLSLSSLSDSGLATMATTMATTTSGRWNTGDRFVNPKPGQ